MSIIYTPESFDPLSTTQLTNTICEIFERQPLVSMAKEIPNFEGSGLYAIYYRGSSVALYQPLSVLQIPVYAGQGRSSNSATGKKKKTPFAVRNRLKMHRKSMLGGGLPVDEFRFRALLMPDVHADLGENGLRVGYQPVWNDVLNGFGSNEQGSATRTSARTKWDTLHSGRSRTDGGVVHKSDDLAEAVTRRIAQQTSEYAQLPWPHPSIDILVDPD
ncbi:Eco29kI family restriction endonuclease [Nocardia sp. NPDC057668]|uniref:Eco29kI family restriction endonuclease n=1 Tax=Nocardia sp. NPDC057668 TaxID=3346202 RepID=UPI00366BAEEA